MALETLRPNLWRWTAPHPDWRPGGGGEEPSDWPRDVGCVLYLTGREAVFVDPLAPHGDAAFWAWADERCAGRDVVVLETIRYHRRSRDAFAERYAAATTPPAAVEAMPFALAEETMYWIAEHRALVPGDLLVCDEAGELRICPEDWLAELGRSPSLEEVRAALGPLLAQGAELVLTSHGGPVREHGAAALAHALTPA